nr:uncharacterized protein [Tanacetum cinerariifolium]
MSPSQDSRDYISHAVPPPDTRTRLSSAPPFPKCQEQFTAIVTLGEYMVMKAEADVVKELINNNTIELVDEMFMECKHQGKKCKECKRPYWKCLALCGRSRDVGIAVHQWWGCQTLDQAGTGKVPLIHLSQIGKKRSTKKKMKIGFNFRVSAEGKMENQTPLKLNKTNKIKQSAVTGLSRGRF